MDNEYQEILPKVSGYLEKKGRKRMISCYKKYWFVLEGRLLLYYKSKDEYEKAISPCKGFISLGHTSNIKLGGSNPGVFQIESKTTTISLRAESKEEQHKWMQALMTALNQKNEFKRLNHFRYSTGDLSPPLNRSLKLENEINNCGDSSIRIVQKLQKLGARTYGISAKLQKPKSSLQRPISLSDEHIPSQSNKSRCRLQKSESVIVENEIYRKEARLRRRCSIGSPESSLEQIYERIPHSVFLKKTLDQDFPSNRHNDAYWTGCNSQEIRDSNEYCYEAIDFNDNVQTRTSDEIIKKETTSEENIYVEADIKTTSTSNCLDCGIIGPGQQSTLTNGQHFFEDKEKRRFCFNGKTKTFLKDKPKKVKKSESFLHRVWSKKSKTKPNKKYISLSTMDIAQKLSMTEAEAMKTLNHLHHLLKSSPEQFNEQRTDGKPEATGNNYEEFNNQNQSKDSPTNTHQKNPTNGPTLPPRNAKISLHGSNASFKEDTKLPVVPPKMKKTVHSIDAILSDLNVQNDSIKNQETNNNNNEGQFKVKELIKRFSIGKEEGVELRQKQLSRAPEPNTSDLDKLLEELAKVTTAPIMTPGVTSSLINPEISHKEIQKIAQSRRISDPDYDIPRPHRSLPNLPKKDDNALEATRFFGPILRLSDCRTESDSRPPTPQEDYHSNVPSITPDSLEVEKKIEPSHDEIRHTSFQSHEYLHFKKSSHHNLQFLVEDHLYADPRLLLKSRNDFSVDSHDGKYQLERSDCGFVDSLDP